MNTDELLVNFFGSHKRCLHSLAEFYAQLIVLEQKLVPDVCLHFFNTVNNMPFNTVLVISPSVLKRHIDNPDMHPCVRDRLKALLAAGEVFRQHELEQHGLDYTEVAEVFYHSTNVDIIKLKVTNDPNNS